MWQGFRVPQPALRLHVAAAAAENSSAGGSAQFLWLGAGLEVCPFRIGYGRMAFSPCARLDLGALGAQASGVAAAHRSWQPWIAPSALARVALRLGRRVSLEADAALVIPVLGSRYYFPPDATVFVVPRVAAAGRLGVSVHFY